MFEYDGAMRAMFLQRAEDPRRVSEPANQVQTPRLSRNVEFLRHLRITNRKLQALHKTILMVIQ
jgi:hypothetical protein